MINRRAHNKKLDVTSCTIQPHAAENRKCPARLAFAGIAASLWMGLLVIYLAMGWRGG
jgi:hypothetical protein